MRDVTRGLAIGFVVLALAGAVASRTGLAAIDIPRPTGTGAWLLARATGYAAFAALSLDVVAGLLVSTKNRSVPRAALVELHGWLSPVALALVLGHALVLLADSYIRFDLLDVIVPFASRYRPVAVGLGVIAGYLAVVVHASFGLRKRLGTKTWRRLHYLSFVAFAGAALHAILAGSDAGRGWAIAICAVPLMLVLVLVGVRISRRARLLL